MNFACHCFWVIFSFFEGAAISIVLSSISADLTIRHNDFRSVALQNGFVLSFLLALAVFSLPFGKLSENLV
ncbi:MAG: hypothetical protein LBD03_08890 [Methanobrevibacter sp.]|nr:hypothetical protein [Candidatus Methanovirga procula]